MGFSPGSNKQSILVYHKKNHYNEWEFVYDPLAEQMMMMGGNSGALNPAGTGTGTNGTGTTGFGGTSGGFGSPTNSGTGSGATGGGVTGSGSTGSGTSPQ
jgi:hypothetical protein